MLLELMTILRTCPDRLAAGSKGRAGACAGRRPGRITGEPPARSLATTGTFPATPAETAIFCQNAGHFAASNAVHDRHMPKPPPTRSAPANVNLPCGRLISADAIAALLAA
jgi:hypothetical protein